MRNSGIIISTWAACNFAGWHAKDCLTLKRAWRDAHSLEQVCGGLSWDEVGEVLVWEQGVVSSVYNNGCTGDLNSLINCTASISNWVEWSKDVLWVTLAEGEATQAHHNNNESSEDKAA